MEQRITLDEVIDLVAKSLAVPIDHVTPVYERVKEYNYLQETGRSTSQLVGFDIGNPKQR